MTKTHNKINEKVYYNYITLILKYITILQILTKNYNSNNDIKITLQKSNLLVNLTLLFKAYKCFYNKMFFCHYSKIIKFYL